MTSEQSTAREPFEFLGLDHIALNCCDMKRTVDFYNGILGMPIIHTIEYPGEDESGQIMPMGQHFFFGVGGENPNAHLAFFYWKGGYHTDDPDSLPPIPRPDGVNQLARRPATVGHINLRVEPERIPHYCHLLEEAGIPYRHTTRYAIPDWHEVTTHNGYTAPKEHCLMDSVYLDDPDGLHLEFNAWLPEWDSWRNDHEPWSDPRTITPATKQAAEGAA
jgi:catechol 2,3-dioxygenase-like lactoylglutathione lyase family enzyme